MSDIYQQFKDYRRKQAFSVYGEDKDRSYLLDDQGEMIKRQREKAGLTQKQLAALIGTTSQNISQYERNIRHPKEKTLLKICDALSCDLSDIDPITNFVLQNLNQEEERINRDTALFNAYQKLNDEGQRVAVERVEELTEIPRYTAPDPQGLDGSQEEKK